MKPAPYQIWHDPRTKKDFLVWADRRQIMDSPNPSIMGYFYKCGDDEHWHPMHPKDRKMKFVRVKGE